MNHKICTLVTIILICSTGVSLFLYASERVNNTQTAISKYPLIDPARNLIAQEHFFSTIEPLRNQIRGLVAQYEKEGVRIGVYIEYLNTGANISINQNERFWPASLSKMPTAFAVMKNVEEGQWELSNELVLFEQDKDERFGELYKKPTGTRFTIDELLRRLILDSDNTAHRILVRNLSSDDYTDIFEALGMEELFDKEYQITAKEYSRIFRSLYNASYLNREHSQILLTLAGESRFDDYLKIGLPKDKNIVFAHKIGEEDEENVYLDSGIVYVPHRPYLITVMVDTSRFGGEEKAKETMQELSRETYQYVANN